MKKQIGQLDIHRLSTELSGAGSSILFSLLWANLHQAEAFLCILRCGVAQELSLAPKLLRKELLMLLDSLMLPTLWEHFRNLPVPIPTAGHKAGSIKTWMRKPTVLSDLSLMQDLWVELE